MDKKNSANWDVLAGVRFGLAMIVLVYHSDPFRTQGLLHRIGECGAFTAVLGFLILSGFSIAHSYGRSSKGFYGRRLLRIYPLYAVAILTAVFTQVSHGDEPLGKMLKAAAGNLLFMQTYKFASIPGNGVLWSLAVEATFYLLTPLLARLPSMAILAVASVSAAVFVRYPSLNLPYYAWTFHGTATIALGWAWLAGFVYYRHRNDPVAGVILTAAVIGLTSINTKENGHYSNLTLLVTVLALTVGGRVALTALMKKVLGFLGDFSYPLYLFHPPAFLFCQWKLHTHSGPVMIAAGFALTLVMVVVDLAARKPLQRGWTWAESEVADAGRYVLARPWVRPLADGGLAMMRFRVPASDVAVATS